jgi:hypothetical protein
MVSHIISALFIITCLIAVVIVNIQMRRSKAVYICDYQSGLIFEDGERCKVLAPGNHWLVADKDPVTVVDMRPYQFILERVPFKDALHVASVISVAGELSVCEPQLSVRAFRNIFAESLTAVRDNFRLAASRFIADSSSAGRLELATQIGSALNKELQHRGVEIRNLEITELWHIPDASFVPEIAN